MKNTILLLFLTMFFTFGCRSETIEETNETNIVSPEFKYNYGNSVNRNFFGQVLDRSGNPVSGATISIGSSTVQTTAKGFFMLKNVSVKENFAHIKAAKSGFVNASRVLLPTTGENRINIMMIPATLTSTVNSGATSTVSLPDGTSVKFDGSFKNENGTAYSGAVKVALFNLKTSDTYFNETMPGSLLAGNSQGESRLLESYGMMHVQLTGDAGQNLQIADGHTAEITSPIDAAQLSSSPATIPLWSFNETEGIWREEGSATKVGNKYVGTVKHFSWWNCDIPQLYTNLHLTVFNSSNQPLTGVKVGLSTSSFANEVYGYSNTSGLVSGIIPANQSLTMKVYNQCNVVIYTSTIGPYSGLNNNLSINIANSSAPSTTITGTLLNCAGTNVTNGLVQLSPPSGNYFSNYTAVVSNGSFSFNVLNCSTNQQFTLNGTDFTNLQVTGNINFSANSPTLNLGNITVCTAVTEFITSQTDAQSVITYVPPISAGFNNNLVSPNLPIGFRVSSQNAVGSFYLSSPSISSVGTYTTNFSIQSAGGLVNANGNNLTLQISNFGAIGGYIDFTINGTYTEPGTIIVRTISATGHVLRDY